MSAVITKLYLYTQLMSSWPECKANYLQSYRKLVNIKQYIIRFLIPSLDLSDGLQRPFLSHTSFAGVRTGPRRSSVDFPMEWGDGGDPSIWCRVYLSFSRGELRRISICRSTDPRDVFKDKNEILSAWAVQSLRNL